MQDGTHSIPAPNLPFSRHSRQENLQKEHNLCQVAGVILQGSLGLMLSLSNPIYRTRKTMSRGGLKIDGILCLSVHPSQQNSLYVPIKIQVHLLSSSVVKVLITYISFDDSSFLFSFVMGTALRPISQPHLVTAQERRPRDLLCPFNANANSYITRQETILSIFVFETKSLSSHLHGLH
jgi:hypothetical protein